MASLNKAQYLKIMKNQLNRLNFIPEDKFQSVIETFKDIDIIGFDIDFTLLQYNKKNMIKLMYESLSKFLIIHKKYPKQIKYQYHKEFIQSFSQKGFIIDYINGNCLKIRKDKSIIKCYHGKKELDKEEINSIYENGKYYLFKKSNIIMNESFYVNMDNFHSQNLPLFMICVDLFDAGNLKDININNYKNILMNIFEGINYNFHVGMFEDFSKVGYYFPQINKSPELYLSNNNCQELLIKLKEKGKHLFFATNSNYSYSNFILGKIMGEDYDKYFDLCIYKSSKPDFFKNPNKEGAKCYFLDKSEFNCNELNDEIYHKIINGNKNLSGGSHFLVEQFFEKMLNKKDIKYLFVGDNILSDCKAASTLDGWNSLFIYDDIKIELINGNSLNEEDDDKYSNIFFPYFEDGDCLLSLPDIEGIKYLIE